MKNLWLKTNKFLFDDLIRFWLISAIFGFITGFLSAAMGISTMVYVIGGSCFYIVNFGAYAYYKERKND